MVTTAAPTLSNVTAQALNTCIDTGAGCVVAVRESVEPLGKRLPAALLAPLSTHARPLPQEPGTRHGWLARYLTPLPGYCRV